MASLACFVSSSSFAPRLWVDCGSVLKTDVELASLASKMPS